MVGGEGGQDFAPPVTNQILCSTALIQIIPRSCRDHGATRLCEVAKHAILQIAAHLRGNFRVYHLNARLNFRRQASVDVTSEHILDMPTSVSFLILI